MDEIQQRTVDVLEGMARVLRDAGLPGPIGKVLKQRARALRALARDVDQPCVLAVVGRVKTGKSTFINALLEADLAVVGPTETTCSINCFRFAESGYAIRCHWSNGEVTDVDDAFVKTLQGYDCETLQRAEKISHIEYLVPLKPLERVTLVDTPGTGAVVEEHEGRTTEFVRLDRQLRQRHHEETRRIGSEADAIIYLVGAVATGPDRSFLERFHEVLSPGASAFNALGVMSRIDLDPEILERRDELAAKVAAQLRNELNTVLPVSAELERTLDRLGDDALRRLIMTLRRIPPDQLSFLLDDEDFFRHEEGECPVSAEERQELLGTIDWPVFTTVARVAADPSLKADEVPDRLRELAGFAPVRDLLNFRFFQRGPLLRCHRILRQAEGEIHEIRWRDLPRVREREHRDRRRRRYQEFLRQAGGDPTIRRELEQLVEDYFTGTRRKLKKLAVELETISQELLDELQNHTDDFHAWQKLQNDLQAFTPDEQAELRDLFGIDGLDLESRLGGRLDQQWVTDRMLRWRKHENRAPRGSVRRVVARQVAVRYGLIFKQLSE